MTEEQLHAIEFAFLHFYHMDLANAAIHTADVRYSPITFRLAEVLAGKSKRAAVREVLRDRGRYEEDTGR